MVKSHLSKRRRAGGQAVLTDYHLHSDFSFDGNQTLSQLCEAAFQRGMQEIAVTEHMDLYYGMPYGQGLAPFSFNAVAAFKALEQMRCCYTGKMEICRGIELGQPMRNPEEAARFLRDWPLDFVIGSVHNMEHDIDVGEYDYAKVDPERFFPHYLDAVLDLAEHYDYDVLGHLTYPARYIEMKTGRQMDFKNWRPQFEAILQAAIRRGRGIELNTSALARGTGRIMPTLEILKLYRTLGGELITLGSDSHVKEQVGTTAHEGQAILREAGFHALAIYKNRKPELVALEESV